MGKRRFLLAGRRKVYLFRGIVCLFTCLVLFSGLGCCSGIRTKDYLPSGTAKGYVEFYCTIGPMTPYPGSPKIYCIDENSRKKIEEGYISIDGGSVFFSAKQGLRIARTPGTYRFSVVLGTADEIVSVQVKEGMVTPVKISFSDVKTSSTSGSGATVVTTTFRMQVTAEEPIPVSK